MKYVVDVILEKLLQQKTIGTILDEMAPLEFARNLLVSIKPKGIKKSAFINLIETEGYDGEKVYEEMLELNWLRLEVPLWHPDKNEEKIDLMVFYN